MGPKYKFGVEIPRSVKHALELDRWNGNNLWKEALLKELAQLDEFQVFRPVKPGESLDGYECLRYHVVWVVSLTIEEKHELYYKEINKLLQPMMPTLV